MKFVVNNFKLFPPSTYVIILSSLEPLPLPILADSIAAVCVSVLLANLSVMLTIIIIIKELIIQLKINNS